MKITSDPTPPEDRPAGLRLGFVIQSHRPPAQLLRLARTLRRASPGCRLLVAHDSAAAPLSDADLAALGDAEVFLVPGPIRRGTLAQLTPYFAALHRLAAAGFPVDWVVYLSAQDYPTQPLAALERHLATSGSDGFLTWWEAFRPDNPWGRRRQGVFRYGYQYAPAPAWLVPWIGALRWLNRVQREIHVQTTYGPRIGRRARQTPFSAERVCYAGSQWTILSRRCAEYLEEAVRRERALLAYYARCLVPDESVVQTLLVNSGRFRLTNQSLRYCDHRGSADGSPHVLTEADLPALADLRYFLARKFALEVDSRVLDRLDERIFAADAAAALPPAEMSARE